jgi:hypothetical protein
MDQSDNARSLAPTLAPFGDVGLFVELGRQRPREIKRLKRGSGALSREIRAAIERWRPELGIESAAEIVPVVVLYRHDAPNYVVLHHSPSL